MLMLHSQIKPLLPHSYYVEGYEVISSPSICLEPMVLGATLKTQTSKSNLVPSNSSHSVVVLGLTCFSCTDAKAKQEVLLPCAQLLLRAALSSPLSGSHSGTHCTMS